MRQNNFWREAVYCRNSRKVIKAQELDENVLWLLNGNAKLLHFWIEVITSLLRLLWFPNRQVRIPQSLKWAPVETDQYYSIQIPICITGGRGKERGGRGSNLEDSEDPFLSYPPQKWEGYCTQWPNVIWTHSCKIKIRTYFISSSELLFVLYGSNKNSLLLIPRLFHIIPPLHVLPMANAYPTFSVLHSLFIIKKGKSLILLWIKFQEI